MVEPVAPLADEDPLRLEGHEEAEIPLEVRVGLESDLGSVELRAPPGGLRVWAKDFALSLEEGAALRARAAAIAHQPGSHRVQVAALRDSRQAAGLAARHEARTGWPADASFDAATGFYRVRVGRFADRAQAEVARRALAAQGAPEAWLTVEAGKVVDPAIEVEVDGGVRRIEGRQVVLEPLGSPLSWKGTRFRGRLILFVNDRGSLNVVNEVDLEGYLRGVVTREMGPGVYPWPQALRAQAIAARSYTLRHLDEFAAEGYDICATPRCQVYRGLDDEHRLSDEAVAATRGLVLVDGSAPADALYSASCGGHTEDVRRVFPTLKAAYLRGVPCIEAGATEIGGTASDPLARVASVLAPGDAPFGPPVLARRFEALAARRGLGPSSARLEDLEPSAVLQYLSHRFDLALDPRLFDQPALASGSMVVRPHEQALADVVANLDAAVAGPIADRLIVALGEALDLGRPSRVGFHSLREGRLRLSQGSEVVTARLGPGVALAAGSNLQDATPRERLRLEPGDPLEIWRIGGEIVAVLALPGGTAGTGRVPLHGPWRRFKSKPELVRRAALEYPGLELEGFEVLQRGVSSRVARLRLDGRDDQHEIIEGLAIRWLLDIPDTRFEIEAATVKGQPGWTFRGRGWGHGVGLCQTGAALMARSGRSFEEILDHYYSGLELAVVRHVERRSVWNGSGAGDRGSGVGGRGEENETMVP